jgi:flagellar FliL protein
MANDEEKTTVEASEETSTADGAEAKGGKKKLFVLAGVGLAAVVIGLAVALFVVKPMLSDSAGDASDGEYTEQTEEAAEESSGHDKPKPKKKPKKSHGDEGDALIYAIKDIVVNPAGTGGSRFLSVSFGFELDSPELEGVFTAKEPAVRDALITILSSKTVAQLTDAKQKEIVRYQIRKRVSKLVGTEELVGVYFTDFVLQ